jgi:hypothetical protein
MSDTELKLYIILFLLSVAVAISMPMSLLARVGLIILGLLSLQHVFIVQEQ